MVPYSNGSEMTRSLAQVNAQIAKLQQQADALKAKEAKGVIAHIREAIAHYELTAADLGLNGAAPTQRRVDAKTAGKKAAKGRPKGKAANVVKYSNSAGDTWSGRGRRPRWFTEALEGGASQESLLANPEG